MIFNSSGQHVQTINRLGQTTQFVYSGGQIQSITLPVISGTAPQYTFTFAAGSAQITSPPVYDTARVTTLVLTGGRVSSIRDPDYQAPSWPVTNFTYDGTNRIVARTNKLNAATRFGYDTVARKLAADSVQLSATPTQYAIRNFKPAEARGAAVPEPTDSVYTYVNGPRQLINVLGVRVDRFGAPTWISDALGNVTQLFRTNTQFPALVTEMRTPNGTPSGLVSHAGYDTHGNIVADTVVSPFGGADAITQYAWDLRFDLPTSVTPPAGPATTMAYDAIGNRLWQQTGTDVNRRVTFEYNSAGGASNGLLRAVVVPKGAGAYMRDSVFYDAMGNLYKTRSPLGRWQFVLRDNIGRDTLSISPIRATDVDSTPILTKRARTRTVFDLMSRVRLQEAIGPADTVTDTFRNQPVITVQEKSSMQTGYDLEGRVLSVERWSTPDTAGVGHLTNSYQYDLGGRKTVEVATDGFTDTHAYDAAGNDTLWTNRKNQAIRMQYDALNRLSQRITPKDSSPAWTDPYVEWAYNPAVISGDTATFSYTPAGAVETANNRWAKVSRSYFPSGAIKADTQRIRTWDPNGSFELHKYVVGYGYDLAGRRTSLSIPQILIAPNHSNSVGYGYDATTGLMTTVTDVEARVFTYQHDLAGRLESLITPADLGSGTIATAYTYDDDGALVRRVQTQGATTLHRDTLSYDGRGKITYARTLIDSTFTAYSGLGHLIWATHRSPTGYQNWEESFIVDALSNQRRKQTDGFVGINAMNANATYSYANGRLTQSVDQQTGFASQSLYDTLGNRRMYYSQTSGRLEEARSYYGGDGKLAKVDRRTCNGDCTVKRGAYEDYRYDALGRRVLVRSQRTWCTSGGDCWSHIQRTVWDGDQVLGEIRMPGFPTTGVDTLEADTLTLKPKFGPSCPPLPPPEGCNPADTLPSWAPWYGHVTYIHGAALDQPLEIIRGGFHSDGQDQIALIPHLNWRGLYDNGTFLQGGPTMKWPASSTEIQRYDLDADDDPGNWFGSMIRDGRDGGGTLYRRNRYYDAATGRFTQEDPIGLAGGMNLYGFAGGDPVNHSDPFGLCVDGITTAVCIEVAIVAATATAAFTASYLAAHPEVGAALDRAISDATAVASDAFRRLTRRIIIGGALIGGALIGKGQEAARAIRDVIRTEQIQEEKRKKDKEAAARKKKEGGGQGDPPPDKDPPK